MDDKSQRNLDLAIKELQEENLYLLAGAGLSNLCGLPRWLKLIKECIEVYSKSPSRDQKRVDEWNRILPNRPIEVADLMLRNPSTRKAVLNVFETHFSDSKCDPSHEQLIKLPFQGYITTNYDKCLEHACRIEANRNELTQSKWYCYPPHKNATEAQRDISKLGTNGAFLLHIHGCFFHQEEADLDNIIFTRSQYKTFYEKSEMKQILELLSNNFLLLLGIGFNNDPYFISELYKIREPDDDEKLQKRKPWFIIAPKDKTDISEEVDPELYDLHPIFFDGDTAQGLSKIINEIERKTKTPSISDIQTEGEPLKEVG